ncbi:carboxypeptidase regulatory-like domain-containing protein [Deinococcus phoenicis]|nr:carboxypeptidase regulatory-like domain-containing protein [Deinococcus phoenicis]
MSAPAARTLLLTALLAAGLPAAVVQTPGVCWGAAQAQAGAAAPRAAEPGEFLVLPLRVPPGPASYAVSATLPAGWALLTQEATAENGTVVVALNVPDDAVAGPQDLSFTLRGPQGTSPLTLPLTVNVAAHPDFVLVLPPSDRLRPGEQRRYTASVTNTGNVRDTLRLRVEGSATVTPALLTLAPGERAEVQVSYVQQSQGNADTLRLIGVSSVDPHLERDSLLVLSIGSSVANFSGPQLAWSVSLAPQVAWNTGLKFRETGTGQVPTLPGLPGGSDTPGTATPAPLDQTASAWAWGGAFSASLAGDLSDYARGLLSYTVARQEDGQLVDSGVAQVNWGNLTVTGRSSDAFRRVGLEADYERGAYTYSAGLYRDARAEGGGAFSVAGRLRHTSGISLTASHTFGVAGGSALGVGWTRRLGAFTPSVEVEALTSGGRWGLGLRERLDYENRVLLAQQTYRYDSLNRSQQLDVRVTSRQLAPFGVSGGLSVSSTGGVWRYALSTAATYRPDSTFGVTLQASYGSDLFAAQLSALKEWRWGTADIFLDGQLDYQGGRAGGSVQATGVIPAGAGLVLVKGTLGYRDGLLYGAGAGYTRGAFSVAGGLQGSLEKTRLTLSAAYQPLRGLNATADYILVQPGAGQTGPVQTGSVPTGSGPAQRQQNLYASVGYSQGRWAASVLAGYGTTGSQAPAFTYGARVTGQVLPTLQLTAQAERTADRTRVALRGTFTPSGAFKTPGGIVNLFGGRNAGTLRLLAFLDRNKNGVQDAGEPGAATRFLVGGQDVSTNTVGEGSVLLAPGAYNVELGGEVLAQYLIPNLPAVTVPLRQTVTVKVPVREVGSVQGQLTDDAGRPVAATPVQVTGPEGTASALTDMGGYYRIGGLDFGTYSLSVQADPALYRVPEAVQFMLDAAHPLPTQDLKLTSAATFTELKVSDLHLDVTLPQEPLPPGAALPVRVTVEPAADTVRLEGLGDPANLTSQDGKLWIATVLIPPGQQTTEVQLVAQRGTQSGSERALLLIDPALPAASLQVAPYNALPSQVMTLRTVLYAPGTRLEVRDETGQLTPLQPTAPQGADPSTAGPREYTAQFAAHAAPGRHTLTLLVDGQPRAEAEYLVLGRP